MNCPKARKPNPTRWRSPSANDLACSPGRIPSREPSCKTVFRALPVSAPFSRALGPRPRPRGGTRVAPSLGGLSPLTGEGAEGTGRAPARLPEGAPGLGGETGCPPRCHCPANIQARRFRRGGWGGASPLQKDREGVGSVARRARTKICAETTPRYSFRETSKAISQGGEGSGS